MLTEAARLSRQVRNVSVCTRRSFSLGIAGDYAVAHLPIQPSGYLLPGSFHYCISKFLLPADALVGARFTFFAHVVGARVRYLGAND